MTDQHIRFVLPQLVLEAHGKNLPADAWPSHDTPGESVMTQVLTEQWPPDVFA